MFETLSAAGGGNSRGMFPLDNEYVGHRSTTTGATDRLDAAYFEVDGEWYIYGGRLANFTSANDLHVVRKDFENTPIYTQVTDIALGTVTMSAAKAIVLGRKAYIFGLNPSGVLGVKIIDFSTRTASTYISGQYSGGTPTCVGADYNPLQKMFYAKAKGHYIMSKFDPDTNTWSDFARASGNEFMYSEAVICGRDGVYSALGYVGGLILPVLRSPYTQAAAGLITPVWHFTLGYVERGSVNQGHVVHNGIVYYTAWYNNKLSLMNVDLENKLLGNPVITLSTAYRNRICFGKTKTGILFGSGTTVAEGQSNWQTNGRSPALFDVTIDWDKHPYTWWED